MALQIDFLKRPRYIAQCQSHYNKIEVMTVELDEEKLAGYALDLFSYLSLGTVRQMRPAGALVFGRHSVMLAATAANLYERSMAKYLMFSGGVGKDSGLLPQLNVSEAAFLAACASAMGVAREDLYWEQEARNGADNCRLGLAAIIKEGLPVDDLILVVHSTQARRLSTQFRTWLARPEAPAQINFQVWPTPYQFNPRNPADQLEAARELMILHDRPLMELDEVGDGLGLLPQPRLPQYLVDCARVILAAHGQ